MRCFRKTVHKQHLEDEVRWLQQMLAKEQQSKQDALGQLQDERAKCAILEMEILHAAQAAQEMGESLCLFFNPCYQQSEQQVHQDMHPLSCEDLQPDAEPVQQQEQEQEQQEVQSQEHDYQNTQLEVQQEPQQEQHSQAQSDLVSNPDTAAHDQAHLRLRENAGLRSSPDHWALQNDPLLAGPLKVSPGRRNSPRRLARSSPRRSLRISSSSNSPMKQVGAAAGSAVQVPAAASAATSSQHLQSNKETCCEPAQLGLAAAEDSTADLPTDTGHKVSLDQHINELEMSSSAQQQGPKQEPELQQQQAEGEAHLNEAAVEASSGAVVTPRMATALHQQDGVQGHQPDRVQDQLAAAAATLAAAAAVAAGQGHVQAAATLPSRQGKAGQSPFSAAAAAAAAIQQSVSAASAAIAAAEAARGKGCPQVQAGPVVLLAPFGSVLSDTPGGRVGREAVQTSEDCDTASSSSSGSGKGCTSHALPHSIVADPATVALEVEHSSTQPEEKSGSGAAEGAGQDQQQQQPLSSAQGTASCLRAAASLPSSNASAASAEMNEAKPSSSSTSTATTNSHSSSSSSRSNDSRPVTSAQEGSLLMPAAARCQVLEGPTEPTPTKASSGTQTHKPGVAQELQDDDSSVPSGILDASAKLPAPAEAVAEPQPTPACVQPASAGLDSGRRTNSSAGNGGSTEEHPEARSPAAAPSSTADARGALDGSRHCSAVEQSTAGREQVMPAGAVRPSASSSDGIQCSNSSIKHKQAMPAAIEHQQQQQEQQQLAWQSGMHQQVAGSSLAASKAFGQDSTARTNSSVSGSTWPGPVHPGMPRVQPGRTLQQQKQQHVPTAFFSDGLPAQSTVQPRCTTHRQADAWQPPQQLQQHRQAGRSSQKLLSCKGVAAANLQPLLPRPQSLHRSAVAAAAANDSTARSGALQPAAAAAAAVMHTGQKQVCMQAVDGGAAAELAPSSCLSPLHWHQANLGSSRPGFYQAMMLSACSNPCSVMRQQLAFEQQDTKAHSKLSQGSRAGKALRSGINKPRKGWMALF